MTRTAETSLFDFDHSFARALDELATPWTAAEVPAAALLELNEPLAAELGLDPAALRAPAGVQALLGQADTASGAIAQAYAGHQFGNYSPRLGDGRALLLGEVIDVSGDRRDLHLKGSGRTPFARGGDGKAAVGPMLREYVMSEAMHALGIPTTRALAVASTGEQVVRETMLPGAVLVRVASSHLRVGTFQYAAATGDEDLLRRLADYAIERHHPDLVGGESLDSDERYLRFYERVVSAQAELVAQWMLVGFIHGVLNTDNVTIAAETIDYGPCAFMDEFDPATVFSSIDHGGRYAYGNQPQITQWNLARLGETLLPLLAEDVDAAVEAATGVLGAFPELYARAFDRGVHRKLGLGDDVADESLVDDWFRMLHEQSVDMTSAFRSLSAAVRGDAEVPRALFRDAAIFDGWAQRWRTEWSRQSLDPEAIAKGMDEVNPIYIPRNHLVEAALAAATAGDLTPVDALVEVVRNPFTERPGAERYAQPAPGDFGPHQTFCGT